MSGVAYMMLCPYVILDAQYQTPDKMMQLVRQLSDTNVALYQLRMKTASQDEIRAVVSKLYPVICAQGSKLILNDHVRLAVEMRLDGVHIGQEDMSVQAARAHLGDSAVVGLSVQTLEQVYSANVCGLVDYIGVGPIFPTRSKLDAVSPIGLERLAVMCAHSLVPVVALGGVELHHLASIQQAGAQSAIMIHAFMHADSPVRVIKHLKDVFRGGQNV